MSSSSQPTPPTAASASEDDVHKRVVISCLQSVLRVTLSDNREVEGTLECFDNNGNMILSDATDISRKDVRPFGRTFRMGMVLVPGGVTKKVMVWRQSRAASSVDDMAASVRRLDIRDGGENRGIL